MAQLRPSRYDEWWMRTVLRGPRPILLAVVLALLAAGCAPSPVTVEGERVKFLYDLFLVVATVVFVIVAGLIGWSIVRYRARPGDGELPPQWHQNVVLELVWWAIPSLLVIVLFILSAGVLADVDDTSGSEPLTVEVTGFQWGWRFTYLDSGVTLVGLPRDPPQVHVPVGRDVTFLLDSPDVVHSFYVPRFLLKRDVVPGRQNRIDVTIDEEGVYAGVCGEFCGLLHEEMVFTLVAEQDEAFEAWLADQAGAGQ